MTPNIRSTLLTTFNTNKNVEKSFAKTDVAFTQAALAYNNQSSTTVKPQEESATSAQSTQHEQDTSEDAGEGSSFRVSTRARYTYELDRYHKNAALIFDSIGSNDQNLQDSRMKMTKTLEKYRFEIKSCPNIDCGEIETVCEGFFSQDFTDYGCVAVILKRCQTEAALSWHGEVKLFKYLSTRIPPTLRGKPIILFTQSDGAYVTHNTSFPAVLPPEDFLIALFPSEILSNHEQDQQRTPIFPLSELFNNINSMGNDKDLDTILNDTVDELIRSQPVYSLFPIILCSTLRKEVRLHADATASQDAK